MKTFKPGSTYTTRSICDHNCIISVKVIRRTPKTIIGLVKGKGEKRLRIREYDGAEYITPWGVYSMSPIVTAT